MMKNYFKQYVTQNTKLTNFCIFRTHKHKYFKYFSKSEFPPISLPSRIYF